MLINLVIITSLAFIIWLIVKWSFQVVKVSLKTGLIIAIILFFLIIVLDIDSVKIWHTIIDISKSFRTFIN